MKPTKIIFLDFDGPMIPLRIAAYDAVVKPIDKYDVAKPTTWHWSTFDPVAVAFINSLLHDPQLKLVISSSWRRSGKERICQVLSMNNISPANLHEDWATITEVSLADAESSGGCRRSFQINDWLKHHPETTHYAVLDDASLKGVKNFVHVTLEDGLLYEHQKQVIKLLEVGCNKCGSSILSYDAHIARTICGNCGNYWHTYGV